MRRTLVLVAVCVAVVAPAVPAALAQHPADVRDTFRSVSFHGNDGSVDWNGPWNEVKEADGPKAGRVLVDDGGPCWAGNCLVIGSEDGALSGIGAMRTADLAAASDASLQFSYRRLVDASGGSLGVHVRVDGGAWIKVHGSALNRSDKSAVTHRVDLSPFVGSRVTIRFLAHGGFVGYIGIDDVLVSMRVDDLLSPPATTTTTTPPVTTTTTTPPVTTTTTDPLTTTTTTQPPVEPTPGPVTAAPPPSPPPTVTTPTVLDDASPQAIAYAADLDRGMLPVTAMEPAYPESLVGVRLTGHRPLRNLNVVARVSAATLGANLLPAVALGLLVALMLVRREEQSPKTDTAAQTD